MSVSDEGLTLSDSDRESGFEEVLISVLEIERHNVGEPNLVRAIIKRISPGLRIKKCHDMLGKTGYQIEMYSKCTDSSTGPEWTPQGFYPRDTPEAALRYLFADLAEIRTLFPNYIHIPDDRLKLTCRSCGQEYGIGQASIRLDESIQCPHCENTATGEENIALFSW